jgi:hypothetical protein
MSAAKFTPGTWVTEGAFVYALNANGHNRFYAGISPGRDDDEARVHDEELFANARLIAAAPTMLEALKFLVDRGLTYFEGRTSPGFTREQIEKAREAIAKAEGRAE